MLLLQIFSLLFANTLLIAVTGLKRGDTGETKKSSGLKL